MTITLNKTKFYLQKEEIRKLNNYNGFIFNKHYTTTPSEDSIEIELTDSQLVFIKNKQNNNCRIYITKENLDKKDLFDNLYYLEDIEERHFIKLSNNEYSNITITDVIRIDF